MCFTINIQFHSKRYTCNLKWILKNYNISLLGNSAGKKMHVELVIAGLQIGQVFGCVVNPVTCWFMSPIYQTLYSCHCQKAVTPLYLSKTMLNVFIFGLTLSFLRPRMPKVSECNRNLAKIVNVIAASAFFHCYYAGCNTDSGQFFSRSLYKPLTLMCKVAAAKLMCMHINTHTHS